MKIYIDISKLLNMLFLFILLNHLPTNFALSSLPIASYCVSSHFCCLYSLLTIRTLSWTFVPLLITILLLTILFRYVLLLLRSLTYSPPICLCTFNNYIEMVLILLRTLAVWGLSPKELWASRSFSLSKRTPVDSLKLSIISFFSFSNNSTFFFR